MSRTNINQIIRWIDYVMLLDVSETIPPLNTLEMLLVNFTLDWPTDDNVTILPGQVVRM